MKSVPELRVISLSDDAALLERWPALLPIEKAALFKLMARERAMGFFKALPFDEQYLLILASPEGSIAPLLEHAPEEVRSHFTSIPQQELIELMRVPA